MLVRGRDGFGGKVKSLPQCGVCDLLRHSLFHGNLCPECERNLRGASTRAWRKLPDKEKCEIADKSRKDRDAALKPKDRELASVIAEQVMRRLREEAESSR